MKIRVSYPGQESQIMDAPSSILNHYTRFEYDPPFIERVKITDQSPITKEEYTYATLWYREARDKHGKPFWDYNHLEDGHCPNSVPTPKCDLHKQVWKGGRWAKALVQLNNGKVEHHLIF